MKRFSSSVALCGALVLGACTGGAKAPTKYIPDAAEFIGGVQLSAIMAQGDFKAEFDEAVAAEAEAKEAFEAAKACKLDPYALESLTFGGSKDEQFAAVLVGAGWGKAENLSCISGKIKEKMGGDKDPITVEGKRLRFDGDDATGFILDDKTLLVASKGWEGAVQGLIDGTGTAAIDGSLKGAVGLADTSKHFWFGASVPADVAKDLGPADQLSMVGAALDFTGGGLGVDLVGKFSAPEGAKKAAEEGTKQLEQLKPMAGMFGVPQPLVDSITLAAEGDLLKASAKASKADLDALKKTLEEKVGQ